MKMNIGENIRKYRNKKGMTQETLASIVGVSAQAVSKWECGESIPDGMLFIPIADTLEISLDYLCGYDKVYESDIYNGISKLINNTPHENRMKKVREVCWQTQKGLFNGCMETNREYNPDEMTNLDRSSASTDCDGFTFISNRHELPFYSVFCEPVQGFGNVLKYDENYRKFFAVLGNKYCMQAFFNLYSKEKLPYIFEKEILATECNIPNDEIDKVINKLVENKFCKMNECEINGERRTLYTVIQRYEIIAILAMLNEYIYHAKEFDLQSSRRQTSWLQDKTDNI